MNESASNDLEKTAARIRALLAKAENTEFPEEAATFRTHAEKLMHEYRLGEEALIAEDQFSILPVTREVKISDSHEFYNFHWWLWQAATLHTGCRTQYAYRGGTLFAVVVGYESDIRYAEGLFQTAWLTMVSHLEPTNDPNLSEEENIYRLRNAGIARNRIAQMMWGASLGNAGHAAHAKVAKIYAAECDRRGEDPRVSGRSVNKKIYRESYARGFEQRFAARLRAARDATEGTGGSIVLKGRSERVDEAFYALYPHLRPETPEQAAARRAAQSEETGKEVELTDREKRRLEKEQEALMKRYYSSSARAGAGAGTNAADTVKIERTTPQAKRVAEGEPGKRSGALALGE